jgi:hypothetical protein
MRSLRAICLSLIFSGVVFAQTNDSQVEIYGQFSAANVDLLTNAGSDVNHTHLATGFRLGGGWLFTQNFALIGDLNHDALSRNGASFSMTSLMAGVKLSTSERYRHNWFAELMFGAANLSQKSLEGIDGWRRAGLVGGGLELRLTPHWELRPLEVDFVLVGNGPQNLVDSARFATGAAYRF